MYDNELELVVARILYHNPNLLDYEILDSNDFFSDVKSQVCKMMKIRATGGTIDKVTIGKDFSPPTSDEISQFENYVKSLKSLALDRRLQDFPHKVSEIVTSSRREYYGLSSEEKVDAIIRLAEKHQVTKRDSDSYCVSNMIDEYIEEIKSDKPRDIIPTHIPDLDLEIGNGVSRGNLVIIAGETGGYKTTLAYNIAYNNALEGSPVMIVSYEMSKDVIMGKLISMISHINHNVLRTGMMHDENGNLIRFTENHEVLSKIDEARAILKSLPIYIISDKLYLNEIKLHALKLKPKILIIDYIGLMPEVGTDESKMIPYITRMLKIYSSEELLNCAIFGLLQFKKEGGDSTERELVSIKYNSGHDADVVLFTDKKEVVSPVTGRKEFFIKVAIKKNRLGSADINFEIPIVPKWGKIMVDRKV